jgi:REP element-mobilizing transposase RayT
VLRICPEVQEKLWGGNIWSAGYFVSTVGKHGNENQIENYVRSQGKEYSKIYRGQLTFFD